MVDKNISMNDMLAYINKMNFYIETSDYDTFIKKVDINDKKYCYFEKFYNEVNEVSIKCILRKVIKEKLASLDLELKDAYYSSEGMELIYSGLVFGNIKIEEKKLTINHNKLKDIKDYLAHIAYSLSVIEDQVSHKFKKAQDNEIEKHLKHIKWCCERLTLPNDELMILEEKVHNEFENLGFEVTEVSN